MIHPVFHVTEWLENQIGQKLTIEKEEYLPGNTEPVDFDRIYIQLKDVKVKDIEHPDVDGYLANQEIILHGDGEIVTDIGLMELPQCVYEIPLFGEIQAERNENKLTMETEKAVYRFYQ